MAFGIFVIAALYAWSANLFFGHHWTPTTPEEVIADGITLTIVALGIVTSAIERRK